MAVRLPMPLALPRGLRAAWRVRRIASRVRAHYGPAVAALDASMPAPHGRLRVLADTTFQQALPWVRASVALTTALRLRGHEVTGLQCDGLLPRCELMLGRHPQPSCAACAHALGAVDDATRLPALCVSTLLRPGERDEAEALVAATPEARLTDLAVDGIPVGRLAARELRRDTRGFVFAPEQDPGYRPWLVSAILLSTLMDRALARVTPDLVFATNGRTLPSALLLARARQRGIRVVTWDTEPTHPDALVFSHDGEAALVPLERDWARLAGTPLTPGEQAKLQTFAGAWATLHHPRRGALPDGLRPGAPCVVAFANSAWDTAALDRDAGFGSLFDWLETLVRLARQHPEVDVVIRAHPAERAGTPDLWSRTPVAATLRERCAPVPPHVHLVDAAEPIDTYALVARATAVLVYSSRIGLEAALAGRRPWIAGETTYRGKGFSRDLAGPADLEAAFALREADLLTPGERTRAERFAYLWWFRGVVRMPWLRDERHGAPVPDVRRLAPGGDPVVDRLVEAIATGGSFADLGPPTSSSR